MVAAVIAASTAYHVALAVGLTAYSARGAPPPGDGLVLAGFLALCLGAMVPVVASVANARIESRWTLAALTALAVALVVARYYSPDPYYLNTDGRIADHYPGSRIAAVIVLSAAVTLIGRRSPRIGIALVAVVMVLCAATLSDEGYGN